jgi:hypothetical protein
MLPRRRARCSVFAVSRWALRPRAVSARLAVMTLVILCIARSPITPRLADTASQNLRSVRLCCSVPIISEGRMVSIGHQVRYSFTPNLASVRADIVPEIVRHRLISVRAYDTDDMCIYDLGDVCDGTVVEPLLERALTDRRTDYVNIHTARPGCFLCRVERV